MAERKQMTEGKEWLKKKQIRITMVRYKTVHADAYLLTYLLTYLLQGAESFLRN